MKSAYKTILIASALTLLVATSALALPMTGSYVRMENDRYVPYTMTDLSDNEKYATFCLESQNYFKPGETYYVTSAGDYADGGGGGAVGGKDYVSDASKWLYAAYMSGTFNSVTNAAVKVQKAIWYNEGEQGGSMYAWNKLKQYSFDASGWKFVAVNLSKDGKDNQSQLVGVKPVPEASSMLLLGTGLVALAGLGRRKVIK